MIDTDVVVAAIRSGTGASAAILRLARDRVITALVSVPLVVEYEAVCGRKEHREAGELTAAEVDNILGALINVADRVDINYRYRPLISDADDELVLETAINGAADLLITFNVADFGPAPERFGIKCVRPGEALKEVLNG